MYNGLRHIFTHIFKENLACCSISCNIGIIKSYLFKKVCVVIIDRVYVHTFGSSSFLFLVWFILMNTAIAPAVVMVSVTHSSKELTMTPVKAESFCSVVSLVVSSLAA